VLFCVQTQRFGVTNTVRLGAPTGGIERYVMGEPLGAGGTTGVSLPDEYTTMELAMLSSCCQGVLVSVDDQASGG